MILECPNCETCYETPSVLPDEGRKVKCARCGHVWHAMPSPDPEPEPELELEPETEPEVEPEQEIIEDETPLEEPHQEIEPVAPVVDDDSDGLDFREADPIEEPAEEAPKEALKEEVFEAMEDEQSFGDAPPEPAQEFGAIEEGGAEQEAEEDPFVEAEREEARIAVPPTMKPPRAYDAKTLAVAWGGFAAGVLFLFMTFYLARVEIVKTLPTSVHIYAFLGIDVNIRGLEFRGIQYKRDPSSSVLRVSGRIVNITSEPKVIPTVVFAFRDERGLELYHWPRKINLPALAPNKQIPFEFELPNPNKLVHSFELRFAKQRNEGG